MIIVQIGANRSNDDLTKIIGNEQPIKLILVEPMAIHNENILKCYSWVNELFIENIAITPTKEKDNIVFYYHEKDGPEYQVASIDKNHVSKHYGWDTSGIKELDVKCMTINELFKKHELSKIDILFIDAEGMDDAILKSIDFSKYYIGKIYFENLHIVDKNVYQLLKNQNYSIREKILSNGWSSLAER